MKIKRKEYIKGRKIALTQDTYTRREVARILDTEMEWQWMQFQIDYANMGYTLGDYTNREDI